MLEDEIEKDYGTELINQFKIHYPKITEQVIPLSSTGVIARTFFDWKKMGLMPFESEQERGWIKLNLIEFVWVKVVQSLRQFGVSYQDILEMKETLYSTKFYLDIIGEWPKIIEHLKATSNLNPEEIEKAKRTFEFASNNIHELSASDKSVLSLFASAIFNVIIKNDDAVILGIKKPNEDGLRFSCLPFSSLLRSKVHNTIFYTNHIQILLHPIIADLLDRDELEKYNYALGLLNLDEQKIIKAIREKNYTEIIIRLAGETDLIIDITKEENIKDGKAREIRKILGLNKYDEIVVKFRNDKEVYIKNKKRLN